MESLLSICAHIIIKVEAYNQKMANETDLLKAKIQERLIESGEYDR